ncbi:hypothetical protein Zmor_015947 [Zophobas morio]|uniref:Uncharacterized protein n=1 Tax=Zophobas morio TaxID=2755281 RepID=A0AA38MI05_9CUCU|nr:hypothetical protein Zmor_015947 [Zophobas morio]
MRSSLVNLLLCICVLHLSKSEKLTFKNVTVRWRHNYKKGETVATSDSLKKIIPDDERVSVEIPGSIPILYEKSVFDIPNLDSLDLYDVGLQEIKPGAFGNLPHLKWLSLRKNNLTEIKTNTFSDQKIIYLDLSFNSIIVLHPGAFNFNANLLILANNKLTEFPSGVFENVTIRTLILAKNFLHTIAPKALSTIALNKLALSNNIFDEINPEILTCNN